MARGITIICLALLVGFAASAPAAASQNLQVGVFLPERSQQAISNHEAQVGRHQDIVMFYQAWGNGGLDTERAQWIVSNGSTPMITWEPWVWGAAGANQPDYSLRKIIAGNHDAYIREFARSVKQINGSVYIRPMHEMNGNWYPWAGTVNGNSPSDYIPAFRHVVNIFRQEGADNVRWVWSPNNTGLPDWGTSSYQSYYPGDDYVDFAGVDGYNFGTSASWSQWSSFTQVFDQAYKTITGFTQKPIIIGETASTEVGGNKAAWITDAYNQLKSNYPNISAIIWFNENKETDWRIESSSASLTAYKTALAGLGSPPDTTPPSGGVTINSGALRTASTAVTLGLQGVDTGGSGLASMRLRNQGGSWQAWQPFSSTSRWTLTSGQGTKGVDLQLRDSAGNLSTVYSDTIVFQAPEVKISAPRISKNQKFTVAWEGTGSAPATWLYTVLYHADGSTVWKARAATTATSLVVSPRVGRTYYFRVIGRDSVGNVKSSIVKKVQSF